jgi:ABC-type nitrate/sulfonate/bicarbonate transport system permease component
MADASLARPLAPSPAGPTRPVPFRGGVLTPRTRKLAGAASLVALVLLWQLASTMRWISPIFAPSPAEVLAALAAMAASGELVGHLAASLGRFAAGFA